jgi:hypothetical protein
MPFSAFWVHLWAFLEPILRKICDGLAYKKCFEYSFPMQLMYEYAQ